MRVHVRTFVRVVCDTYDAPDVCMAWAESRLIFAEASLTLRSFDTGLIWLMTRTYLLPSSLVYAICT